MPWEEKDIQELASVLYYDLKDKYIDLQHLLAVKDETINQLKEDNSNLIRNLTNLKEKGKLEPLFASHYVTQKTHKKLQDKYKELEEKYYELYNKKYTKWNS